MIDGEVSGTLLEVTIDRISESGNPVAEEEWKDDPILVKRADKGETVIVELYQNHNYVLGRRIRTPSPQQKKVARDRRERLYGKQEGTVDSSDKYSGRDSDKAIQSVDNDALRKIGEDTQTVTEGQDDSGNRFSDFERLNRNPREEQNLGRD